MEDNEKFYLGNGEALSSLEELAKALKEMDAQTYACYVNSEKNDFANWIHDIIGDKDLAKKVHGDVSVEKLEREILRHIVHEKPKKHSATKKRSVKAASRKKKSLIGF